MPPVVRLNKNQLLELIESIEAGGGDATEFRRELPAVEPEVKRVPQTRRDSRFREEEETMEERVARRVGYLFPDSIPPYKEIMDYDYRFNQKELVEQCRKAGLGVSGDKHELAAKLIAYQRRTRMEQKPELVPDNQVEADNHLEMSNEWKAAPGEVLEIPPIYFDPIQYEVVVFGRFDFVIQCVKYYPTEKGTWTFDGALMDTSTLDSLGNITEQKRSYYPAMSLTNATFIIIPKPKPLNNPEEYRKRLQFKVVVIGKREWTFQCADYKRTKEGMWEFEGVLRDTSGRVPKNDVTLKLVNAAFMVLPAPEAEF